ncbi:hypothetical protein [Spirochaeta dissipatitropha]
MKRDSASAVAIICVLGISLIIGSCDLSQYFPDSFSDLHDTELLSPAAQEFSLEFWTAHALDHQQPEGSGIGADTFIYFQTADGSASIEARNLFFNGDFSQSTAGPLQDVDNLRANGAFSVDIVDNTNSIDGHSLQIDSGAAGDAVFSPLRASSTGAHDFPGLGDQAPFSASYFVRLDLKPIEPSSSYSIGINNRTADLSGSLDDTQQLLDAITASEVMNLYRYPFDFFGNVLPGVRVNSIFSLDNEDWTEPVLQIPVGILDDEGGVSNVVVDNIRVGRADVEPYIEFLLNKRPFGSSGPELVAGGRFVFSFEYSRDPAISAYDTGANRFHSRGISIDLSPTGSEGSNMLYVDFAEDGDGLPPETWTPISIELENGIPGPKLDEAGGSDPVLSLRISPQNNQNEQYSLDVGGLRIRNAGLRWHKD